ESVDLVRKDIARQPVRGYGLQEHAARLLLRFEYRGPVSQARQEVGAGKPRGARADHGHFASRVVPVAQRGGDGEALLLIREETLDRPNRQGLVQGRPSAFSLAGVKADARAHRDKGIALA